MKALFICLSISFVSFPFTNSINPKLGNKRPNEIHTNKDISRDDLIKAIHSINANLSFKKGKDINSFPHFFANEKGKFSVDIIGTENSTYSVKFIVIIDRNNNQERYLQIVESISQLLSGSSGKTWVHKNIAQLTTLDKDFHSALPDSGYSTKLDYLSKNKLLTVDFKRQ
ncbi:hypothetical protein SAMN05216464_11079 [Mucilaginibacter pineti]|uniref:Uncharacterized protein n=1 Tax=Mucilaginibacter pineti TaxID=1391627 RepID=A0A1G7GCM2_9SPHI|nr:hypothetical protein [Mucilaginibacter pineti]SDE85833.1 hypothetical protein SAMN05216464_11079 [Mucilaginibacter pineti]